MKEISDEILVVNIGHPSQEICSIKDTKRKFYMLGSMGLASSIGLGMAMSTDKTVISIDGDGSVLMNMGSLATIGAVAPKNYILVIIDNKAYGSTGFQKTFTKQSVDLKEIALGCSIFNTIKIKRKTMIRKTLSSFLSKKEGPYCLIIETKAGKPANLPIIPHNSVKLKNRFMKDIAK